jgi:hypothetical protein
LTCFMKRSLTLSAPNEPRAETSFFDWIDGSSSETMAQQRVSFVRVYRNRVT